VGWRYQWGESCDETKYDIHTTLVCVVWLQRSTNGGDVKCKGHSSSNSNVNGSHGLIHDGSWGVDNHHL
jgi:hypothetical protein